MRVLGVMSADRLIDYPDITTAREAGYDWVAGVWRGLTVPKGTPPSTLSRLEEKCLAISESAAFKEFMAKNRFGIEVRGSQDFTEFVKQQDEQWLAVVKAAGYVTD